LNNGLLPTNVTYWEREFECIIKNKYLLRIVSLLTLIRRKLHLERTHSRSIEREVNVVFDAISIFETLYNKSNGDRQKIISLGVVTSVYIFAGFITCEACENIKPINERRPGVNSSTFYAKLLRA